MAKNLFTATGKGAAYLSDESLTDTGGTFHTEAGNKAAMCCDVTQPTQNINREMKEIKEEGTMENNNNKEMNVQELSVENLEQVSAGYLGFLLPIIKKIGIEVVHLFK